MAAPSAVARIAISGKDTESINASFNPVCIPLLFIKSLYNCPASAVARLMIIQCGWSTPRAVASGFRVQASACGNLKVELRTRSLPLAVLTEENRSRRRLINGFIDGGVDGAASDNERSPNRG